MITRVLPPTPDQLDAARRVVADHLAPTPSVTVSVRGRPVVAKLEGLQVTGAFKIRGALAAVDAARREEAGAMVVTASAGNHGLGIAHAAQILDVRAVVVVPVNASAAKVKKLRGYPIELIQHGANYDEAQAYAQALAATRSLRFISAFNDTHVVAGQSTVFDELIVQRPDIEHVVVPVGGGGLISGVLMSRAEHDRTDVVVSGVQPEESCAMWHVLRGVPMSEVRHRPTIADGLAGGGDEGAMTNSLIAEHHVALHLVPERAIRAGVREAAESTGLVLEGSAATPFAAIAEGLVGAPGEQLAFIASGRNIATDLLTELLAAPPSAPTE